jgi:4-amino-4-deoxy-L-arabinose transferase-like glycosyltransferase
MIGLGWTVRPLLPVVLRAVARPDIMIGVVAAALLLSHLDDRDLWASHEARAAQNARHILTTGSLGVSRLIDGTPELQKPPLYYWLVAAVSWARGGMVDEVAVRLPAAIAGWLTVVLVVRWLQRQGLLQAAWVAGMALLTMHHFHGIARTGRIDVPLTACVTAAILAAHGARPWVAGLATGAGMLLKGPIGPVLTVGVLVARRRPVLKTALIALAISLPWFVWAGREFNATFFWYHNLQRATGSAPELARHPLWFYPVRLLLDTAPWSLLLPVALWQGRRSLANGPERLAAVWLAVSVGLLSLSRFKRADYLLPAYPAVAILIGCWAERHGRLRLTAGVAAAGLAGCLLWRLVGLPAQDARAEQASVAAAIRRHVPVGSQIVFFRVEDHLLAHHLGPPIATVREWENLEVWVSRLTPGWIVLPTSELEASRDRIRNGALIEVERFPDRTDRERPRNRSLVKSQHDAAR